MCFGCTSFGPNTAAIILFFPNSINADPSAFFITPALIETFLSSSGALPLILSILFSDNINHFEIKLITLSLRSDKCALFPINSIALFAFNLPSSVPFNNIAPFCPIVI